jgi:hypothetical protein
MNPYGYAPPPHVGPSREDESNLNTLSILFYCYAGFCGLAGIGVGGALTFFLVAVSAGAATAHTRGAPGVFEVGALMTIVFGFVIVLLLAKAIIMILAGRNLSARSGYTLATVGAVLALSTFPLGTALGVFTLITLSKPGVKAMFRPR